jgi:hypothetical protein
VLVVDFDFLSHDVVPLLAQLTDASGESKAPGFVERVNRSDWPLLEHCEDLFALAHMAPNGLSLALMRSWVWRHGGCHPWRSHVRTTSVDADVV